LIVAGIDIGHLNIKTVILKESECVAGSQLNSAGVGASEGRDELDRTARKCGASFEEIDYIVSTGSGVEPVHFAQKHKSITSCLVKGATRYFESARTLIDIGAETFTIIKMNAKGRALNFIGNDTCAAGTGVFLDTMAKAMRVSIEEMGPMSLEADKIAPISNMCAVFAESEVVSLVHKGISGRNIIAGLHKAIAERIIATAKRIGIKEDIVVTGGVANNIGCVKELEKRLGWVVHIPERPEITAAYGAALMAEKLAS
jgi:predicted CoA-substrate-specific enzyme activase